MLHQDPWIFGQGLFLWVRKIYYIVFWEILCRTQQLVARKKDGAIIPTQVANHTVHDLLHLAISRSQPQNKSIFKLVCRTPTFKLVCEWDKPASAWNELYSTHAHVHVCFFPIFTHMVDPSKWMQNLCWRKHASIHVRRHRFITKEETRKHYCYLVYVHVSYMYTVMYYT